MIDAGRHGDLFTLTGVSAGAEKNVLLTGATGFLGSQYLYWRLRFGGRVFVLVRDRKQALPLVKQRVRAALEACAASYLLPFDVAAFEERVEVIAGDVTFPHCGVSVRDRDMLRSAGVDQVWHCAASLEYQNRFRDTIWQHNVDGTRQVLALAENVNAGRFMHVSTAYVAGNLAGAIPEATHTPPGFCNVYEESKHAAEAEVVRFCSERGIPWNILRPSVIIGPSETRRSGGSRFGLYGFVQELHRSLAVLRQTRLCRLVGHELAALNFVPVDHVVYDMLYLGAGHAQDGRIYHSANPTDFNVKQTIDVISRLLELQSLVFSSEEIAEPSGVEELFHHRSSFYGSYFHTQKRFERSLPAHKPLHWGDFETYMATFISELDSERDGILFERKQVKSRGARADGRNRAALDLVAFTLGDPANPPIVLVNAYGMPSDFMKPLAARLAQRRFVVTWESRWVPAVDHVFDPSNVGSDVHVEDLLDIMDAFNIARTPLTGWSSGAQVVLRAMAEHPDRFSAGVLINSPVAGHPSEQVEITSFEKNVRILLGRIAGNYRYAEKYCDLIYGTANYAGTTSDRQIVSSVLTSTDPFLLHMTSVPFRTPARIFRYAHMMVKLFTEAQEELPSRVQQPVLVYAGEQDLIASPAISHSVAKRLLRGTLHLDPSGDHFSHYYNESFAELVEQFVAPHDTLARMEVVHAAAANA